ncbi:MAG: hypothetical protein HEQ15_12960 [Betaproteobacteria bacterium]|jgi:hypothetical protein
MKFIHRIVRLSVVYLFVAVSGCATNVDPPQTGERRYVSADEFKRLVGPEEYARLLREASDRADEVAFELSRAGAVLHFRGPINEKAAIAFEEELGRGATQELRITSDGGSVDAGLRIGRLVRIHGLHVVVEGTCVSSCANYVFTAGRTRTITTGAVVVWHGNTAQKDGREMDQCGAKKSSFDDLPNLPEDFELRRANADEMTRRREAELAFFASVGVDDYIARVGQEPKFYGNFTMSVDAMAMFGLRGVKAPADYGSRRFCQRINRARPEGQLHCIAVTDHMLAYERARRALGEVCQPDGTLRVRTSLD